MRCKKLLVSTGLLAIFLRVAAAKEAYYVVTP